MLAPRDTLWSAHEVVVEEAVKALNVVKEDVLADYGCGDGRVLRFAAKTIGCRCVGYEINTERAAEATAAAEADGVGHLVTIHGENALNADFSEPSAVFLFLIKRGLRIMLKRLDEAARSRPGGLRVVTALYKFPPEVVPQAINWVSVSADLKIPLYVYSLPLPVPTGEEGKVGEEAKDEEGAGEEESGEGEGEAAPGPLE